MEFDTAHVWITTRRLKPGAREEFSRSWRPREFPDGMLKAYELYSPDGNEVVGISIWESAESRDRYRTSDVESERRRAPSRTVRSRDSRTPPLGSRPCRSPCALACSMGRSSSARG